MKRTVISHDVKTATAVIRFEHNDVDFQDTFNLDLVIPGVRKVFEDFGLDFDEAAQLKAMDQLTQRVERMINDGAIRNAPTPPAQPEAKI